MKNVLNNLLRFGLSGLLLWWLSTKIDFQKTAAVVKTADLNYIFIAGIFFFLINAILIVRWMVFMRAMDLRIPVWTAVRFYLIGLFGNLFLPSAIGGDVIKIVGLCRNSDEKPKVVASVLLDRLSGLGGMVIVAGVSGIFGLRLIGDPSIFAAIGVLAAAAVAVVLTLFNERVYAFFSRIFGKFPKLKDAIMQMHHDISLLKGKPWALVQAVCLAALSQLMLAFIFYLLAKALHQNVALLYCIIFMPLVCVISTVPSIGGLGVREAGVAYFFGKVGVESGIAVSMGLINFLFMILVGLLGGLFFLVTKPQLADTKH